MTSKLQSLIEKYGPQDVCRILDEMRDTYCCSLDEDENDEEDKAFWIVNIFKQFIVETGKLKALSETGKNNFTAIDFETAHPVRNPCQMGIVVVRDGRIVEEKEWLIRPPDNNYDQNCINKHGITPAKTVLCPEFDTLWPEIKPYLDNEVIVGHNLFSTDIAVLDKIIAFYGLPACRPVALICTISIYGKKRLKAITKALNIEFENQHDALADARACAQIFLAWLNGVNPDELDYSKEKKKEKSPACHAGESEDPAELNITDLSGVLIDRDFFRNRNVLLSGGFERYPSKNERDTELKLLLKTKFGAIVRGSAVKNLDFFIIGSGPGWSKTEKVLALIKGGRNVQVLTDAQLYDILDRIE